MDLVLHSFLGISLGPLLAPGVPPLLPANGFIDITDDKKDWPGLLPRLFVDLDTLLVEEAAAQVTRAGMEARRFCKASTGMYMVDWPTPVALLPPGPVPPVLPDEFEAVGDTRPF